MCSLRERMLCNTRDARGTPLTGVRTRAAAQLRYTSAVAEPAQPIRSPRVRAPLYPHARPRRSPLRRYAQKQRAALDKGASAHQRRRTHRTPARRTPSLSLDGELPSLSSHRGLPRAHSNAATQMLTHVAQRAKGKGYQNAYAKPSAMAARRHGSALHRRADRHEPRQPPSRPPAMCGHYITCQASAHKQQKVVV